MLAGGGAQVVVVADVMDQARANEWHGKMRQEVGSKLACRERRGAARCGRNRWKTSSEQWGRGLELGQPRGREEELSGGNERGEGGVYACMVVGGVKAGNNAN